MFLTAYEKNLYHSHSDFEQLKFKDLQHLQDYPTSSSKTFKTQFAFLELSRAWKREHFFQ